MNYPEYIELLNKLPLIIGLITTVLGMVALIVFIVMKYRNTGEGTSANITLQNGNSKDSISTKDVLFQLLETNRLISESTNAMNKNLENVHSELKKNNELTNKYVGRQLTKDHFDGSMKKLRSVRAKQKKELIQKVRKAV